MSNFVANLHVFNGPSLSADYRAMRLRFNSTELFGDSSSISAHEIASLKPFFPENVFQRLTPGEEYSEIADFIAALAISIQEVNDELGLRYDINRDQGGETEILMGFCSEQAARSALQSALRLALFVKGRLPGSEQEFQEWLKSLFLLQKRLQPLSTSARMLKYSRQAGIPHYQLDATSRHISYGQGVHSTLFNGSLSSRDSHIGEELQRNKFLTNKLLRTMGYPCTRQYLAYDLPTTQGHARKLGFPLVIKPSSASRGNGVTANIRDAKDIDKAFKFAARYSNGEVIVERFIAGDEHRITVSNGKVIGLTHKAPPAVEGDGHSTIRELIEAENAARIANKTSGDWHHAIPLDEALDDLLKFEHLTVDSVPEPGKKVVLRDNPGVATGGTRPSVIHLMHPDIAEMAIAIARGFRLRTIGVDFITTDISASWRDTGKVIEVNAFPSLYGNLSERMLQEYFPTDRHGRIPSVLIVTDNPAASVAKLQGKLHEELITGYVDRGTTRLDGVERLFDGESLYRRCISLLIDTLCEAIVVAAEADEIIDNGLPLEFFDQVYIERTEDLTAQLERGGALYSVLADYSDTLEYI